jgi:C-terminal processing protease CtpA/Prc
VKLLQSLSLLSIAAVFACAEPTLIANRAAPTNAEIFDELWSEFDLQYSFFEVKGVDWDSLRAVHRPRAIAAPNDAALARELGNMLAVLHDRHVYLATGTSAGGVVILSAIDTVAARNPFDAGVVDRNYLTAKRFAQGGHVGFGFVTPSIGYVRIASFDGNGWVDEIDEALVALKAAQSLIIDVRGNRGGNHALAIAAAGRFVSSPVTYSYTRIRNGPSHGDFTGMTPQIVFPAGPAQFRGQVTVLTNRSVYSSAEDFVLAMSALPLVTTMGDSTGGASGRPMTRELPNGWTYQLSTWIEYTLDHHVFENVGLGPDVYVPSTYAELARGVDAVIDRAIAMAKERSPESNSAQVSPISRHAYLQNTENELTVATMNPARPSRHPLYRK